MDQEIRSLIRQVLAEELGKLKGELAARPKAPPREERVRIASDQDLAAFVRRLLQVTRDGQARREIEEGRWVFRLGEGGPAAGASPAQPAAQTARIERGFVSERQVDALPEGTTLLQVGKAVRLTPLGRDRLRQRGIAIERSGR